MFSRKNATRLPRCCTQQSPPSLDNRDLKTVTVMRVCVDVGHSSRGQTSETTQARRRLMSSAGSARLDISVHDYRWLRRVISHSCCSISHQHRLVLLTHRVHLWLDGKRVVHFILAIIAILASYHDCGTIKRNLSKSAFSDGVGHFECKF